MHCEPSPHHLAVVEMVLAPSLGQGVDEKKPTCAGRVGAGVLEASRLRIVVGDGACIWSPMGDQTDPDRTATNFTALLTSSVVTRVRTAIQPSAPSAGVTPQAASSPDTNDRLSLTEIGSHSSSATARWRTAGLLRGFGHVIPVDRVLVLVPQDLNPPTAGPASVLRRRPAHFPD
jgi:hypothetical protein